MVNTIIQFNKADINKLNYFFKHSSSWEAPSHNIRIEKKPLPAPDSEPFIWDQDPNSFPWIIYDFDESLIIGEIYYHPGPQKDSLLFDYSPEFTEPVQQLIEKIKISIHDHGLFIIVDNADLIDSQESTQNKKKGGRPELPPEVWTDRIEKVMEGIELKEKDPSIQWNQIPNKVGYRWGDDFSNRNKSFENARKKLSDLEKNDPHGILDMVRDRKKKKDP